MDGLSGPNSVTVVYMDAPGLWVLAFGLLTDSDFGAKGLQFLGQLGLM